ncbi:FtsB family cell division protein [Carnobacterium pleistocenium]|uniref:FtsB family cell division protein n=1 Tax=Carnobacterium pleistocenium TaxID=181073 RepID=UPI000558C450|nr:septum formation initiator family protein [Carnobacterium pleistocenium]
MKEENPTNVSRLNNEYTHNKTLEVLRKRKQKRHIRRRIVGILVISGFFVSGFAVNIWTNTQTISQMEEEKTESQTELKLVEKEQDDLDNQIKKLEDEDYVAKVARSQYYLSEDNEIIFSLPEDNAANDIEKDN